MVEYRCNQCNNNFSDIGKHWARSPHCEHPELTDRQKDIITGLLMGDGSMHRPKQKNRNPRINATNTVRGYLDWLDDELGVYSVEVCVHQTPEEAAKSHRDRGFNVNAEAENYSTSYRWRTMYAPVFQEFAEWYKSGKKQFPEDIHLSPLVLKNWYVCDGHYDISGTAKHIDIGISNECGNQDKIENMFNNIGFSISSWNIWNKNGSTHAKIRFNKKESIRIFEYMGEPIPRFEYKWPASYRNT